MNIAKFLRTILKNIYERLLPLQLSCKAFASNFIQNVAVAVVFM